MTTRHQRRAQRLRTFRARALGLLALALIIAALVLPTAGFFLSLFKL